RTSSQPASALSSPDEHRHTLHGWRARSGGRSAGANLFHSPRLVAYMTAKPNLETVPRGAAPAARETSAPSRPTLVSYAHSVPGDHIERNPGMPLDLDVVRSVRVNRSAVERRAATIPTRRTVKKEWQAAWLLRAITL